jgi:hypothetical protein
MGSIDGVTPPVTPELEPPEELPLDPELCPDELPPDPELDAPELDPFPELLPPNPLLPPELAPLPELPLPELPPPEPPLPDPPPPELAPPEDPNWPPRSCPVPFPLPHARNRHGATESQTPLRPSKPIGSFPSRTSLLGVGCSHLL